MRFLSLFSGIEAASAAWNGLGWQCVAFAEIDPAPCRILAHHFPGVPNLGDVTKIDEFTINMLGPIDVVIFGSPCQDLSLAGKRKGLAGERSGLFHTAIDIVGWAREYCGLRWALWENVFGAFSSNAGADFAVVVGSLAGLDDVPVPPKGWGNEGVALGEKAMVEWATLDAQWFGVAQRRRRVFALADFGDWASRPPILLEPESLRGDSAPCRSQGEDVAGTVTASLADNSGQCFNAGLLRVEAFGGNNQSGPIDVATALNACSSASGRLDFESETFITCTFPSEMSATQYASAGDVSQSLAVKHTTAIAFHTRGSNLDVGDIGDVTGTIGTNCDRASGSAPMVAYMPARTFGADGGIDEHFAPRDVSDALHTAVGSGNKAPIIAFQERGRAEGRSLEVGGDVAYALTSPSGGGRAQERNVLTPTMQVRRFTPLECERLQGFPDHWTAVKGLKDGPRYKAIGNSMAVPVINWIGRAIEAASWDIWQ